MYNKNSSLFNREIHLFQQRPQIFSTNPPIVSPLAGLWRGSAGSAKAGAAETTPTKVCGDVKWGPGTGDLTRVILEGATHHSLYTVLDTV